MENISNHWYATEYHPIQNGSIDGTDTIPHDKALIRALLSKYDAKKDPKIKGNPYKTLFVGRLNFKTTEETIYQLFKKYGEIRNLRIVRNIITNESRGYCFIEYKRERDFLKAYNESNRMVIDGNIILVDYERERLMKGWKPRRLGGGLGGEKKSGQVRFGGRDKPFKKPFQHNIDKLIQANILLYK